jgi:uncharacterized protein YkwD
VLAVHHADPLLVDNLAIVSGNLLSAAATDLVGRAVQFWMRHAGHRANLLDRDFNQTGVGVFAGVGDSYWVTQLFVAEP